MSRPSRARGLKLEEAPGQRHALHVAPFTGAWIETQQLIKVLLEELGSRPSRARGLKHEPIGLVILGEGRALHGRVD